MVRKFCSDIYLQLMIVMCFKKHLIFGDDPLFPDGKEFGDVSCQNVIMIVYLSKSHAVGKWGEMDASTRYVLLRSVSRFFSFITFKINKVLNISY